MSRTLDPSLRLGCQAICAEQSWYSRFASLLHFLKLSHRFFSLSLQHRRVGNTGDVVVAVESSWGRYVGLRGCGCRCIVLDVVTTCRDSKGICLCET